MSNQAPMPHNEHQPRKTRTVPSSRRAPQMLVVACLTIAKALETSSRPSAIRRSSVGGPQDRVVEPGGASPLTVLFEEGHQRRWHRLLAFAAFRPEPDGRSDGVDVAAGGAHGIDQLAELGVVEGPSAAADPPGFVSAVAAWVPTDTHGTWRPRSQTGT